MSGDCAFPSSIQCVDQNAVLIVGDNQTVWRGDGFHNAERTFTGIERGLRAHLAAAISAC